MSDKLKDSVILQSVLDSLDITANAFSIKLNYKAHASVYHVLNGINNLSSGMIERTIKAFPNVNYNYMTKGQLPVLLDEKSMQSQANVLNIPLQEGSEMLKIKRIMQIPERLDVMDNKMDRIEGKLDLLIEKSS